MFGLFGKKEAMPEYKTLLKQSEKAIQAGNMAQAESLYKQAGAKAREYDIVFSPCYWRSMVKKHSK